MDVGTSTFEGWIEDVNVRFRMLFGEKFPIYSNELHRDAYGCGLTTRQWVSALAKAEGRL